MHVFDTSYFEPDIKLEIDHLVGKSYGFLERIKMGGIGSRRMMITEACPRLQQLLPLVATLNYASVELRPKGIIVHFKNNTIHYSWVIPYYKLHIYQSSTLSIHADGAFLKFNPEYTTKAHYEFFKKMLSIKLDHAV